MKQDRLNDWANGPPAIAASLRYFEFSAADAVRRMQGDMLALLGFGSGIQRPKQSNFGKLHPIERN